MKLRNNLIVTLPDFAKHFDYNEFWENRRQFIRDMHPSKVYYWDEKRRNAYDDIVLWINGGESVEESIIESGIRALEVLIDRPIGQGEIEDHNSLPDLSSHIIRVQAGTRLDLPSYTNETFDNIKLCYHKIEVHGQSDKPAVITIGIRDRITLYATEFVYVTEVENLFIEFLPRHIQNSVYNLSLVSEEGNFFSSLNGRSLFSAEPISFKDVISFALTDDGYIFIDSHGKPIIMSNSIYQLKYMLKYNGNAFYVKANENHAVILYQDGTLKSTSGNIITNKVVYASI